MAITKTYENYPVWSVLMSNALTLPIYALGMYIIWGFGWIYALLYLGYCLALEIRLFKMSCVDCYYYGKLCFSGRGKIAALFFKKGDPKRFTGREITWKHLIFDFLVPLIPLGAGIALSIFDFNWPRLIALVALMILGFPVVGYLRGELACKFCKQRELGCPAPDFVIFHLLYLQHDEILTKIRRYKNMRIIMQTARRGDQYRIIVPRDRQLVRMPVNRSNGAKCLKIVNRIGLHIVEKLLYKRWDGESQEFQASDSTIIVSEFPNRLRTIGTSCCLAMALVDSSRLVGAVIHIYPYENVAEPAKYALWAMNSQSKDVEIGLSGVLGTFGGEEHRIRQNIASSMNRFGTIVYNQLGISGDIAAKLERGEIHFPNRSQYP
jgi:hypothetical protein